MQEHSNVVYLPATESFTADQALHSALQMNMSDVLICGYDADGDIVVRSSRMSCAQALWLAKKLEQYCLDGGRQEWIDA